MYKFLFTTQMEYTMSLAKQFNAAGIRGSKPKSDKGWTFKAQKAYVRNRFEKVERILAPVYNHKVEQVARAIIVETPLASLNVVTQGASLHYDYQPDTLVRIGKLTRKGATFSADSNTALAILGLNGAAVLYWLGGLRINVDDQQYEVITNDGEYIYATVGIILQLARDCVFNRDAVLANFQGAKRVRAK